MTEFLCSAGEGGFQQNPPHRRMIFVCRGHGRGAQDLLNEGESAPL
jgi:hypothetical protein